MQRQPPSILTPAAWREWFLKRRRFVRIVLIVVLILGPLAATAITLLFISERPTDVVVPAQDLTGPGGLRVRATIREVDPFRGELSMELLPVPVGDANEGGRFKEAITLLVNDASGTTRRTFEAGTTPSADEAVLSLTGSRPVFYPLDQYTAELVLFASAVDDTDVPIALEVINASSTFVAEAVGEVAPPFTGVELELRRPANVLIWTGFLAVIWWALAVVSISIVWQVVMWHEEIQFWVYGFLIGVLFALPQMRDNLPGAPPRGSLVDYAAFYWAIGIVALCLILIVVIWNRRLRDTRHERGA